MKSKLCTKCGIIKSLEGFHKNPKHPGGYHRYCKDCRKEESYKRYLSHQKDLDVKNTKYNKEHRLRRRAIIENYRCRKNGIIGVVSYTDWKNILIAQDFICTICGKRTELEVDHIIPISENGKHEKDNIQGLCKPCNVRKGDYYG